MTEIEPTLRHPEVAGWHHHHTNAGAIIHHDEASSHMVDVDGTVVITADHRTDHDEHDVDSDVRRPCTDPDCPWQMVYPPLGAADVQIIDPGP